MAALSRRQLARYAADQLLNNVGIGKLSKELAAVLVESKRISQAELLARDIAWELEHRGKIANAQITSARTLSRSLLRQIEVYVKKAAKVERVIINEHIDEEMIGGVRIDTANHSWDKTLKHELTEIREVF